MNSSTNAPALLRTLIVYAICVPLAIFVGYLITDPLDYETMGFLAVIVSLMLLPIILRWHYPLLLFSATLPAYAFFIKGSPTFFMLMTVISLGISILERVLSKRHFLSVSALTWPLVAMLAVVFITAELTGGFGLRSTGSDVYGGKKYVALVCGILSYFAITARPIPPEKVRLYISLFFIGGLFSFISDLYVITPTPLQFIFLMFKPNVYDQGIDFGFTRLPGVGFAGLAGLTWMMARHGLRGTFLTRKFWRTILMVLFMAMMFLGGSRSAFLIFALLAFFLFFVEGFHRTAYLPFFAGVGVIMVIFLVLFSNKLPYTYQRSLAFLPLDLNPAAVADAEGSSDWRINMWEDLLPQVPKYLMLGKGYAISPEEYNEMMGQDIAFHEVDASQIGLALAGDYHNGPLSVVLPFGLWGSVVFLFFIGGCWRLLHLNFKNCSPEFQQINGFLFAYFLARTVMFFFVFGALTTDMGVLAQLAGLSIAINNGVRRSAPADVPVTADQSEAVMPSLPRLNPAART